MDLMPLRYKLMVAYNYHFQSQFVFCFKNSDFLKLSAAIIWLLVLFSNKSFWSQENVLLKLWIAIGNESDRRFLLQT